MILVVVKTNSKSSIEQRMRLVLQTGLYSSCEMQNDEFL
jgi:hypothetical protein